MSTERALTIALPLDREIDALVRDLESAHRRASKSEPGERTEIVAYETLCSAVETRATVALAAGNAQLRDQQPHSPSPVPVRVDGHVLVAVNLPLEPGQRMIPLLSSQEAPPPALAVEIRDDLWGRELVAERFRTQLAEAIAEPGRDRATALCPSGVHNRVLTEELRKQVIGTSAIAVPVLYRDGSRASTDFPLRCLNLRADLEPDDTVTSAGGIVLRLALLSIRHTELDAVVDGAWLRNADVSKARAAAQTDDYVHHASLKQLKALTQDGRRRVRIYLYQTGLETALVGLLRAVVEVLYDHPGYLEVVPMFFVKGRPSVPGGVAATVYEPGDPWAVLPSGGSLHG